MVREDRVGVGLGRVIGRVRQHDLSGKYLPVIGDKYLQGILYFRTQKTMVIQQGLQGTGCQPLVDRRRMARAILVEAFQQRLFDSPCAAVCQACLEGCQTLLFQRNYSVSASEADCRCVPASYLSPRAE